MGTLKPDPWIDWYCGREGEVEEEIPELEKILTMNDVVRILDLGCGTGRHTLYFARRGFKLTGLDQSGAAIERAKKLLKQKGASANLRSWDMISTLNPYDNSFFDAIIAIKVIHHTTMMKIRRILAEITRITKRGGLLHLNSPTYEKAIGLKKRGAKSDEVESGTFLPHEGEERGILHHHFTETELRELVSGWNILDLHVRAEHYILTAMKTA